MWKTIKYYPYEVNQSGFVRNKRTLKVITPILRPNGYMEIRLSKDGKSTPTSLHRLVYKTFKGDIQPGNHINHINGLKGDNRLRNLEEVTPQENQARRIFLRRGSAVNTAKLSEDQVMDIRRRKSKGESSSVIAREYGLYTSSVNKIVNGYSWKHLPILSIDKSFWGQSQKTGAISGKKLEEKYGKDYFKRIRDGNKFKRHCDTCTCASQEQQSVLE